MRKHATHVWILATATLDGAAAGYVEALQIAEPPCSRSWRVLRLVAAVPFSSDDDDVVDSEFEEKEGGKSQLTAV